MKYAGKLGVRFALILGENEIETNRVTVKDMQGGEPFEVSLDGLAGTIEEKLRG